MKFAYICATSFQANDVLFGQLTQLADIDWIMASKETVSLDYDGYIYQTAHGWTKQFYEMMFKHSGIVILHNYILSPFLHQTYSSSEIAQLLRYCYGRLGETLLEQGIDISLTPHQYPMFEAVVDTSLGIIVHSEQGYHRILSSRPLANITKINRPILPPASPLHHPHEPFSIGVFTNSHEPTTLISLILPALKQFQPQSPHQIIVGSYLEMDNRLKPLLADYGFSEQILPIGPENLSYFVAEIDIAIAFDLPTDGEMPRLLLELMAHGLPIIIPEIEPLTELPKDSCVKLKLDDFFEATFIEMLQLLSTDSSLCQQIGRNAQTYIEKKHNASQIAEYALNFIHQTISQPNAISGLLPRPADDVLHLLTDIASDLADLGLGENELDLIQPVAEAIVELDLPAKP